MKKIITTSVVGIALFLLVVVLLMAWSFWEPSNIEKDSLVSMANSYLSCNRKMK